MAKKKKKDSSWKNINNYAKGKERLKNAVYQHPDEDPGDKSVYNYMRNNVTKRSEFHILPFKQYEKIGKMNEDMLYTMDSPAVDSQPGQIHQTPASVPSGMDTFSLAGPSKDETKKKKKDKKSKGKVLKFSDFVKSKKLK